MPLIAFGLDGLYVLSIALNPMTKRRPPRRTRPAGALKRRRRPRTPPAAQDASAAVATLAEGHSVGGPALNVPATYWAFCYLLVVGVLLAFAKTLTLVIAALVLGIWGIHRFERRFPFTASIIAAAISGLCGGRRRRW
jgi:hypothetical protein